MRSGVGLQYPWCRLSVGRRIVNTILRGLGRQIAVSVVLATLVALLLAIVGLYFFYALVMVVAPQLLGPPEDWIPAGIEWVFITLVCVFGLTYAVFTAIRLAGRIVAPIVSVAGSARRIARGDLAARAMLDDRSLGEAAMLVGDFNAMADALERASKDVSRWNALIAHELRTPVTILRGRLQGLVLGVFEPDADLFRGLLVQVDGLARLVEDLRTVSLTESGHLDVRLLPTDLASEIEDLGRLMEPVLREAGFTLELDLAAGTSIVDPQRIRQALIALIENARRYAIPGKIRLSLELLSARLVLSVADDGPGLPDDFIVEAFDPFRSRQNAEHRTPSSGLGLTVVRAIAIAHGGTASYRPRDGGACFVIDLPRHPKQD